MPMTSESGSKPAQSGLQLEPVLDLGAAERLHGRLTDLRGRPLDIDASQVERLGGLCLQVLLSARKTWREDGQPAVISQSSSAFDDAWALFAAPRFSDLSDSPTPFEHEGPDA